MTIEAVPQQKSLNDKLLPARGLIADASGSLMGLARKNPELAPTLNEINSMFLEACSILVKTYDAHATEQQQASEIVTRTIRLWSRD